MLHVEFPNIKELYRYFGDRNCDKTFRRGYTKNTPYSPDECVAMCKKGLWLPLVVKWNDEPWQFHYLWNMDGESTFCSAATFDPIRGHRNSDLRRKAWQEAAVPAIFERWGYEMIHGYCLATNEPGVRWVLDDMQCVYAGTLAEAVEHEGVMTAIVVNTVRREDVANCRERIQALYPGGVWQKEAPPLMNMSNLNVE